MQKIKIFQFPIRNSNGGVTHYAMNNWKLLDKSKFDCDFGTVSKVIDFEDEIILSGAGLKYISCYAEEDEKQFAKEIKQILLDGQYDVVHLHTNFWKSFLVEEIAVQCNIPKVIVHAHNTNVAIEKESLREEAEILHNLRKKEFNLNLATHFFACSQAAADWLFGEQIPRNQIKILNNAVDVDKFAFDFDMRNKYRNELGLRDGFVLGNVGRFAYQKNHDFLIEVFHKVSKRMDNVRLLLVGEGPLEAAIKEKIDKLGLLDKVIFLGYRDDVNCLLQAMDVFCFPSHFEGLPISLVEAQTSGLYCVASDTITSEVVITENIEMLPLDVGIWCKKILEIGSGGKKRRDMREQVVEAGYDIRHQIKFVEKVYMDGFNGH